MQLIQPDKIALRFHKKYRRAGYNECWEWQAGKTKEGYGSFYSHTEAGHAVKISAHRYAYMLDQHVTLTDDVMILHECNNPGCVNPLHLREGTHADNMLQMKDEKRAWRAADNHCQRGHEFSVENTYICPRGRRVCKTCRRLKKEEKRTQK